MKVVLSGLASAGKSTIFKALVGQNTQAKTAASGKIRLNIGILEVKDERLEKLGKILNSEKLTYPQINLIDLHKLGEKTSGPIETAHIREFDTLALVIGVFLNQDAVLDLANIEQELVLADTQVLQSRIERINKERKSLPKKQEDPELLLVKRLLRALEEETPVRNLTLNPEELKIAAGFQLLTLKPVIVIANVSEEELNKGACADLQNKTKEKNLNFFSLCAKLEAEIDELPEKDRPQFMQEMGLDSLSKERFIQACLGAQDIILFFTVVGKEARAWPITRGTTALQAAGCVHSDMEKGFIRAEVINYKSFLECGSFVKAKEEGLLRLESKEYSVQDGDIINFKFSV